MMGWKENALTALTNQHLSIIIDPQTEKLDEAPAFCLPLELSQRFSRQSLLRIFDQVSYVASFLNIM